MRSGASSSLFGTAAEFAPHPLYRLPDAAVGKAAVSVLPQIFRHGLAKRLLKRCIFRLKILQRSRPGNPGVHIKKHKNALFHYVILIKYHQFSHFSSKNTQISHLPSKFSFFWPFYALFQTIKGDFRRKSRFFALF
jgi:hypothetical protein